MTIARKHDTVAGQCPRQSAGLSRFVIWHFKLRHYPPFLHGHLLPTHDKTHGNAAIRNL